MRREMPGTRYPYEITFANARMPLLGGTGIFYDINLYNLYIH